VVKRVWFTWLPSDMDMSTSEVREAMAPLGGGTAQAGTSPG
jgi:hypothetical protein